jgi:hypothetical protein
MNHLLIEEIKVAIIDMDHLTVLLTSNRLVKLYNSRILKYRILMITIRTIAVALIDQESFQSVTKDLYPNR